MTEETAYQIFFLEIGGYAMEHQKQDHQNKNDIYQHFEETLDISMPDFSYNLTDPLYF